MNLSLGLPGLHHTFGAEKNTFYLTVHVIFKLRGLSSKIHNERPNALPLQLQAAIALPLLRQSAAGLLCRLWPRAASFRLRVLCVPIWLWNAHPPCAHLQFVQEFYGLIFSSLFCTTFGVIDP